MLDSEKLDEYMKNPENADKYIREIAKDFGCGKETVRVALKKSGYTRKKDRQNTGSRTRKK
ncbi:IS630 transposase-related protein [Leptotrichia sp. HSP-342]|uniref:IS630 transposase-related protein n=1 Tax=Leptotrichia mesophila TaxID=3239303 RepID=A0AB39V8K5_9FUSO